ncbi:hypothetical protein [Glycomyces buryatensis]|uniref:Uncharacterized protein n=1 Tax=Glycomyces buryatensis TaxID=2570927 RepID=A0A4S8PRP1_9ACTN|nr:hypothetical protein [Glycomyces buryatensis]THV33917.1 hypothetical protein FAB82_24380 [Glycomyces buryatensis]
MALLSVPVDPVPAWVKIDLQLHRPYRTFFGFGHLRCEWCGEAWGRHGCPARESAARLFVYTARPPAIEAALLGGDLTPIDLRLRRGARSGTGRHRRKPRPYPPDHQPPNPLAAFHFPAVTA